MSPLNAHLARLTPEQHLARLRHYEARLERGETLSGTEESEYNCSWIVCMRRAGRSLRGMIIWAVVGALCWLSVLALMFLQVS